MIDLWPGPDNPIVGITYRLVRDLDEGGNPLYGEGEVRDRQEIEEVQQILEGLQPHPAAITAKPMGEVRLELAGGARLTLLPIFHPLYKQYRDLLKIDAFDLPMPEALASVLNRWRKEGSNDV